MRSDIIQIKISSERKEYPYDLVVTVWGNNDTNHVNATLIVPPDIAHAQDSWHLLYTWDVSDIVAVVPISKSVPRKNKD